jgi:hypothetical protein
MPMAIVPTAPEVRPFATPSEAPLQNGGTVDVVVAGVVDVDVDVDVAGAGVVDVDEELVVNAVVVEVTDVDGSEVAVGAGADVAG